MSLISSNTIPSLRYNGQKLVPFVSKMTHPSVMEFWICNILYDMLEILNSLQYCSQQPL